MSIHEVSGLPLSNMLNTLSGNGVGGGKGGAWETFSTMLAQQVKETDRLQKESKSLTERALLGNAGVSLHEAQIASSAAELHLRLLLQLRNKALEVYHEVITMPTA